MAGQIIKLQTNIPVTGTVKYVDYIKSKNDYADQVAIKGEFDGAGEGRVYLHLSIKDEMVKLGIIAADPSPNGSYQVLKSNCRVKISKVEQGTSKITTIELLSSSGSVPATPPQQQSLPFAGGGSQATHNAPQAAPQRDLSSITDLISTYEDCLKHIAGVWQRAGGDITRNSQEIAAGAHTLFIQRCKVGMFGKTDEVNF